MYSHKRNRITIDVTNKCTNLCPGCSRQKDWNNGKNIPGEELSIKSWEMITDYFDAIGMCGQISDPTLHNDFHTLLKIAMKKNVKLEINCAASYRSKEWYTQSFQLTQGYQNIQWVFGIDGLPKDSHKYRINQDGEKLYEVMKTCAAMGHRVTWQYIPFNFNENDIDTCVQMAQDIGVKFKLLRSSRWGGYEHLQPKDESLYVKRTFKKWETRYDILKKFYLQNGHSSIPSNFPQEYLYRWSNNQRTKYQNNELPENKINLLNEIEFVWETEL